MENIISVIVITYNQEHLIGRALDSILSQKCDWPMEVIIGEDCSTDNTRQVCRDYAARYPQIIRLLENSANIGIVENYKSCLSHVRGRYLMDCGGDDEWCPGRMQMCLDIMQKHESVSMLYTDIWLRYDSTGQVRKSAKYQHQINDGIVPGDKMTYMMLDQRYCAPAYSAMVRTEHLLQIFNEYPQFFSGRRYGIDDQTIAVLIGKKGDAYYSSERTYYYTSDTSSFIHNADYRKRYHNTRLGTELTWDLAQALNIDQQSLKACYEFRLYALMMHAFRNEDIELRQDAVLFSKSIGFEGWRFRVVRIITSCRYLWKMAIVLRNKYKLYLKKN